MALGDWALGDAPLGDDVPASSAPVIPVGGITLRIGPAERNRYLAIDAWKIEKQLNGRDTMSCTLKVPDGYLPELGHEVVLLVGDTRRFAGRIFERRWKFLSEGRDDWWEMALDCVDWNALADKILVSEVYEGMTAGAIFRDLATKYLAADGVTLGGVEEGPVFDKVVFPDMSVAACFDELSGKTGLHWHVDVFKVATFFARGVSLAPFTLVNGVNAVFRSASVEDTLAGYRNVQYIDRGYLITDPQTEFFRGDSTLRSFPLRFPVHRILSITRQGQPQTHGPSGLDALAQWTWTFDNNVLAQRQSEPVLLNGELLTVQYEGRMRLKARMSDPVQIAARQAIEGGSGRYEAMDSAEGLDGLSLIIDKAKGLLRRNGTPALDLAFETDEPGLDLGQQLTVQIAALGAPMTNVTTQIIEFELWGWGGGRVRTRARCSTGEVRNTETDLYRRWLATGPRLTVRPDDVLNELITLKDEVAVQDSFDPVGVGSDAPGQWGVSKWGQFIWG